MHAAARPQQGEKTGTPNGLEITSNLNEMLLTKVPFMRINIDDVLLDDCDLDDRMGHPEMGGNARHVCAHVRSKERGKMSNPEDKFDSGE